MRETGSVQVMVGALSTLMVLLVAQPAIPRWPYISDYALFRLPAYRAVHEGTKLTLTRPSYLDPVPTARQRASYLSIVCLPVKHTGLSLPPLFQTPPGTELPGLYAALFDNPAELTGGGASPQSAVRPTFPQNNFLPLEPRPPAPKVQWGALMGASLRYLAIMHSYRVATEAGTRYALAHNSFWGGYLAALGAMHGWSDGDGYYENYLGHPVQGAVNAYIWIHNDPKYRKVEFGRDPNYWKSRLRAYAFAWAFSEQFEVGLISEASIGQIQRYCCAYGFVDHVITPNAGMVWLVGEDAVDRYVVRKIEDRTRNQWIRIPARVAFNPLLSFANVMNLEYPWHRENRLDPDRYIPGSFAPAKPSADAVTQYPLVPKFEVTGTVPSYMHVGGLACLGGGGVAGFKISDTWQWTAEVSGCTLGNSLPKDWSGDSLTFATGPQWIRHTESRWSPYAFLRFGGQKITEMYMNQQQRQLIEKFVPPGTKLSLYYDWFTTHYESTGPSVSLGGGLDYRLYAGLAVRAGSLELVHSWLNPVHGTDFNSGIRFTTGLVLRIGTW